MTINNRTMNDRLGNLERCAEHAPAGTYERAIAAVDFILAASNAVLSGAREAGFSAGNDDRLRNVEIALYEYLLASNPHELQFITDEGFGAAMLTPARERVIKQAERDREALGEIIARARGRT